MTLSCDTSSATSCAIDEMPVITLSNGLRVGNFSSPHPFQFTDGSELPACTGDRARALMLNAVEVGSVRTLHPGVNVTNIALTFLMSPSVLAALRQACEAKDGSKRTDVDVVLVPLPVREALRNILANATDEYLRATFKMHPMHASQKLANLLDMTRVCCVADRVTKTIHTDRFCI